MLFSVGDNTSTQPEELMLSNVFARTVEVFGAGRTLFGTDSSVSPRGWRNDIMKAQLNAMEKAGLKQADREKILSGSMKRILKVH